MHDLGIEWFVQSTVFLAPPVRCISRYETGSRIKKFIGSHAFDDAIGTDSSLKR